MLLLGPENYYTLVWYGACTLEFNAGDISIVAYGGAVPHRCVVRKLNVWYVGGNDVSAILWKTTETAEVKT